MSKIVILAGDYPPIRGGISTYLHNLASHFSPDEVEVICLPSPGSSDFDKKQKYRTRRLSIPELWGPDSKRFKFLSPFYFREITGISRIDYLLCGQAHHTLLIPAWLSFKTRGIPYGVIAHGNDVSSLQANIFRRVTTPLLRSAQAVLANSQRTSLLVKTINLDSRKIHVINPVVDIGMCNGIVSSESIRNKYSLQGKKCLLTVSRLVERKGCDTVIKALPEILRRVPDAHYVIVGTGPFEHELRQLTRSLDMESHVTFTGFVEDLPPFYDLSDVFVMISREIPDKSDLEGFGLVFLEANLFGKPVVGGRSGGITDAVLDGQTGFLVDPGKPLEVAEAVTRLLLDQSLSKQLGEAGRIRVLQQFSGESAIHKLKNIMAHKGTS